MYSLTTETRLCEISKGPVNERKLPGSHEDFFIFMAVGKTHKPLNKDVSMDLTVTLKEGGERQREKKTSVNVSDCFI